MKNEELEQLEKALTILERLWGYAKEEQSRPHEFKIINIAENKNFNKESINNVIRLNEKEQKVKYKGITIFKKQNCSTWYTRYRMSGKQHYISGKTQKDVYEKLKELLNENNKKKSLELKEITYLEWQKKWLETYKSKNKETTLKTYKSFENNLSQKFKNKKIKNILEIDIIEELKNINGERQKQKIYEYLKDVFNKAKLNKILTTNILDFIEKPKYNKNTRSCLTSEEEKIFIEKCKEIIKENSNQTKYAIFFLLMLYQGLRPGECLALKPLNFDLENNVLKITNSKNANSKEENTKNEQSIRNIPIFLNTLKLIQKTKILETKKDKYIFNFKHNAISENFSLILQKSNIKKYVPYELRHTFITRCKEKNIPEHVIQSWVGHEIGSKVTSQVYTHFDKTNEKNILTY